LQASVRTAAVDHTEARDADIEADYLEVAFRPPERSKMAYRLRWIGIGTVRAAEGLDLPACGL
jgi:hypothetical protein